ncbi:MULTISPECIES: D-alanyl-D-alanine carboxypeptidase family protein [unclassified Leisingera]|uniref:D-alanyl-D-alanine carboxypeptidase family protein n=1 Tax=unclassified Leisingera TaxID=2614906 RepID=UPI00030ABA64|nr:MULTISPECIES: D-alanyl-D-alanine carboxypeptidase family protein [unclassified Leisingera]KIC24658.1 D-alanyl-D-alanine carboxypeptidase [Leisingera sp. ANG-S3]KIC55486.1 D-alanyl-D-alanine carboxypeptidase [Leisingera sp. ANG-S]KID09218.1 D-alanyl-D-alanine carboxypeptidase [Leisingera sp. ANG1]
MAVITQVKPASGRYSRTRFLWTAAVFLLAVFTLALQPQRAAAAPYAAMVIDARTGEVLHSRNADTRLHPASLTKMMTLYIAFEAVRNGEITLDTKVRISRNAAAEPPSKLGLKSGQKIAFRYLIRAAAVKSANDAATAIGETLSGSEAAFARRMNRTAKALGMSRTTFKNAHGLTASGHLSTASDMTTLGRHLLYDYPEYYNLFSRRSTNAGIREVPNTNRRLLAAYRGADGIKTGYTRAAGFNLVASAKRGNERIIATVFGGKSTVSRNAKVAELLDLGFRRAPSRAALRKPQRPAYQGAGNVVVADADDGPSHGVAGKTIRVSGQVNTSLRPKTRPGASESPVLVAALEEALQTPPAERTALEEAVAQADAAGPETAEAETAEEQIENVQTVSADGAVGGDALRESIAVALAEAEAEPQPAVEDAVPAVIAAVQKVPFTGLRPVARPASLTGAAPEPEPVVVTRLSTSGGRYWGVNVGLYTSRYQAEKVLLRTALAELETLDGTLRKVVKTRRGFEANFLGMTQEQAELACRRLNARNVTCAPIGPS